MPVLLLILLLLFPQLSHAQTTTDLYSTAVDQGSQYRSAYSDYVRAKNQHIQYGTAATRSDAISKTTQVLEKRNAWEIAYLRYLRQTLADSTDIANYSQTVVYLSLETQISGLTNKVGSFASLDSFSKINLASGNWESNLTVIDPLVSAAQMQTAAGRLTQFQSNLLAKYDDLAKQIGTPSAAQKSTLDLIKQKYDASVQLTSGVNQKLAGFSSSNYYSSSSILQDLGTAKQNLQDSSKLLLELYNQTQNL